MFISCLRSKQLILLNRQPRSFSEKIWRRSTAQYIQGQSPEPRVREYFYYIDHQGMVLDPLLQNHANPRSITKGFALPKSRIDLLSNDQTASHDNILPEKKFLAFFFKRLKTNNSGRYSDDFPYISLCGAERNFVRCDDLPIVFTKLVQKENDSSGIQEDWFSYAHTEELMVPFEPQKLFMHISSGRVYHPAPERVGGIGLVRSKVAIELSTFFQFAKGEEYPPSHFLWRNELHLLDTEWYKNKLSKAVNST